MPKPSAMSSIKNWFQFSFKYFNSIKSRIIYFRFPSFVLFFLYLNLKTSMNVENETLSGEIKRLEAELVDTRAKLDVHVDELNESRTNSMNLEEKLKGAESCSEQLRQQLVRNFQTSVFILKAFEILNFSVDFVKTNLENEKTRLNSELDDVRMKLSERERRVAELEASLRDVEARLNDGSNLINDLNGKIVSAFIFCRVSFASNQLLYINRFQLF